MKSRKKLQLPLSHRREMAQRPLTPDQWAELCVIGQRELEIELGLTFFQNSCIGIDLSIDGT